MDKLTYEKHLLASGFCWLNLRKIGG